MAIPVNTRLPRDINLRLHPPASGMLKVIVGVNVY